MKVFENKTLLITGGTGSFGNAVLRRFLDSDLREIRIFSRDRSLARRLIEECRDLAIPDDGKLTIRVANYGAWTLNTRVAPRPLESVVLDGDQANLLLDDMREFLSSQAWYHARGVPYRRGYLLFGPPGLGQVFECRKPRVRPVVCPHRAEADFARTQIMTREDTTPLRFARRRGSALEVLACQVVFAVQL